MKKLISALVISITLILCSCSSGPKRSMLINTIFNSCNSTLEAANGAILSGDYNQAFALLNTASTQALSIDNYNLLISVDLTYVSLFLSYNPPNIEEAYKYLERARSRLEFSDLSDNDALCTMAEARILISLNNPQTDYSKLIKKMENAQKNLKENPYNQAQCFSILGDLYRLQANYKDADKAYNDAAKIFTDEKYLSEIGITWYKIAQNHSQSGNKKEALKALETAIYFDRCAENSMALGADYYIKAVILLKGVPKEVDIKQAEKALLHSAEIYASVGLNELAQKSLDYLSEHITY